MNAGLASVVFWAQRDSKPVACAFAHALVFAGMVYLGRGFAEVQVTTENAPEACHAVEVCFLFVGHLSMSRKAEGRTVVVIGRRWPRPDHGPQSLSRLGEVHAEHLH